MTMALTAPFGRIPLRAARWTPEDARRLCVEFALEHYENFPVVFAMLSREAEDEFWFLSCPKPEGEGHCHRHRDTTSQSLFHRRDSEVLANLLCKGITDLGVPRNS